MSPEIEKALYLRHIDGYTMKQVADHLGRPVNTLKGDMARARRKLRERLTFLEEGESHY